MSTAQISLSKLQISPQNARKTFSKSGIEEMQASILAHGLMQNLVVTKADDGMYYVLAGGRRLSALQALQKQGKLPKDHEVACQLKSDEQAAELSLAENIVREAMHPADEFSAFASLIAAGASAEQVAIRFGKTEKYVLQRMKLAAVAPSILKAYRAGDISLEVVMAYTITDDQKRQAKAFKELEGWMKDNPREIRARLTDKMVRKDDRLAKFVGLAKYEKAGGKVKSDLFGDDVFFEDSELLQTLASEKLATVFEALQAEGWLWINSDDSSLPYRCDTLEPIPQDAPPALVKQHDKLLKKIEELEEKYQATSDEEEEDLLQNEKNALEDDLAAVEEKLEEFKAYSADQMAISGCCVSIGHNGKLSIRKGLVRPEDKKKIEKSTSASNDAHESEIDDVKAKMPESLRRDLESYRQQVAMVEIASHPAIAFDLMAFTIAYKCLSVTSLYSGPAISFTKQYPTHAVGQDKTKAAEALEALKEGLPLAWLKSKGESNQFHAFCELSGDDKDRILAYCTALTLQPQLNKPGYFEDALARTGGKVAEYWRPTASNYLSRIKREQLMEMEHELFGKPTGNDFRRDWKKTQLVEDLDAKFAKSDDPNIIDEVRYWLPEGMAFSVPQKKTVKAKKKAA